MHVFANSVLLRARGETRNFGFLKESPTYRVLVFDSESNNTHSPFSTLYGGIPVLIFSVSSMNPLALRALERPGRTVWAMNLPYSFPFFTVINSATPVTSIAVLSEGSTIIPEKRREQLYRDLEKATRIDIGTLCCSCFMVHGTSLHHEGHYVCTSCENSMRGCNHTSHGNNYAEGNVFDPSLDIDLEVCNHCNQWFFDKGASCMACNMLYCSEKCKSLDEKTHCCSF